MANREQQYTHIYDELIDKLGEGTWRVYVGGVSHFARIGTGATPLIHVYLNEKDNRRSVQLKAKSFSLSRDSTEYARTILECLDPNNTEILNVGTIAHAASIQTIVKLEGTIRRTFPPNLFKTIFKAIVGNGLESKGFIFSLKEDSSCVTLCNKTGSMTKPFLAIGRQETDKEILGRLLCGVYLSNEYAKQKSWKNLQEERA